MSLFLAGQFLFSDHRSYAWDEIYQFNPSKTLSLKNDTFSLPAMQVQVEVSFDCESISAYAKRLETKPHPTKFMNEDACNTMFD